jgi:UDP-N-acetylmuramoyl-tripeptide--D-alanyl-D-alanine ligase
VTRVLSARYNVTSTPGNLNNDIGVPLSLLGIGPRTELAVIEMGASHPDDIEKLVKVCEPDYGLITNVGKAHLLGFGSFEGVKHAKGCLYDWILSHGGRLFLNLDDPVLVEMVRERGIPDEMVVGYGISHSGSIVLPSDAAHPYLRMAVPQEEGSDTLTGIETHLAGAYNANNVAAAIAVGLHFGVPLDDAVQAIEGYVPTNNRSQMEDTGRNTLIVDAYNANPTSMAAALDNLALVQAPLKAAFLGDMRELGADSLAEHETILGKVRSMGLGLVCLVGEEFGKALRDAPGEGIEKWFPTSADLASWLEGNPVEGMTILVKGSRGIQMETVLPKL